ncbi:MAG: PEP-CTERM sorting domain-containing protein [Thermoguttaceae bacterium]|nr:PEP-CTERM sorting domain-containing protein [Thermoguttaceae bacterium]
MATVALIEVLMKRNNSIKLFAVLCSLAWSGSIAFTQTQYETAPAWSGTQSIGADKTVTFKNCLFGQTADLTVDVDGTMVLDLSTGSDQHLSTDAAQRLTLTGGGTIQKTGTDTLYSANGNYEITISMDAGGLLDIQNGTWVNGHYQKQIWTANKGDINLGENGSLNLWDGGTIMCDKLTGTGTVMTRSDQNWSKNPLTVGVNNGSSTFDGKLINYASLKKVGTGTLTLTGTSTHTGTSASPAFHAAAGTLALTGNGTLGSNGTVRVDQDATLSFTKSEDYYFAGKLTGNGTVEINNYAVGFHTATDFTGTFILNDGILRNNSNNTVFNGELVLNGNSGLKSGWEYKTLTFNGKISNGTSDTLRIFKDSNVGSKASWVVLTNPENTQTNTIVDHYLRITNAGALGTGTVTILTTDNIQKVLDLNGCDFDDDRLAGNGIVTNLNANKMSTVTFSAVPTNTFQGNLQLVFDGASNVDLTLTVANAHTGGTVVNEAMIRTGNASVFGTGTVTLNGGTIFNNNNSPNIPNDVILAQNGGGLRVGWNASGCVLTLSGDISGAGKMFFNSGESNPSIIVLSGNNSWTGGTTFDNGGGTNLLTLKSSNALGTGTVDTNGKNVALTFDTANTDITLANPWKISAAGVTMKNTANGDVTLSGNVTGTQTFAITENKGRFLFNGAPASAEDTFSVSVGQGTFAGSGTIGKDLTLAAGTTFQIDEAAGLDSMTVGGAFNAADTVFDITLTGETEDFFGVSAETADLTNAVFNITYAGAVDPSDLFFVDLIQTKDTAAAWDGVSFDLIAADSDAVLGLQFLDGNYQLVVGGTASLPEPGTWALLLLGTFGIGALNRGRKRQI